MSNTGVFVFDKKDVKRPTIMDTLNSFSQIEWEFIESQCKEYCKLVKMYESHNDMHFYYKGRRDACKEILREMLNRERLRLEKGFEEFLKSLDEKT